MIYDIIYSTILIIIIYVNIRNYIIKKFISILLYSNKSSYSKIRKLGYKKIKIILKNKISDRIRYSSRDNKNEKRYKNS